MEKLEKEELFAELREVIKQSMGVAFEHFEDRMAIVAEQYDGLAGKIDGMSSRITRFSERMDGFEEKLDTFGEKLDSHTEMIGNLAVDLEIVKTDVREIRNTLDKKGLLLLDRRVGRLEKKAKI